MTYSARLRHSHLSPLRWWLALPSSPSVPAQDRPLTDWLDAHGVKWHTDDWLEDNRVLTIQFPDKDTMMLFKLTWA